MRVIRSLARVFRRLARANERLERDRRTVKMQANAKLRRRLSRLK